MRTGAGFSTEAVYIFHNMVRKLRTQHRPDYLAAIFESQGPTFRDEVFEAYKATPGNRGAWLMWRPDGEKAEIITLSFWESRQAIQGFAGQDIEKAVFYPEDDRFLVERDLAVHHYEVASAE